MTPTDLKCLGWGARTICQFILKLVYFFETFLLVFIFKLTRRGNLQWNDCFWWIVLDLPEISKSSNKIWNGKSVEIALRNDSEFLRCGPLCAQYLWAAFDISSALPGQYLSFCRDELIVLMEYATSEIGQRWSPSWLQKVWDLKKRLFKDIQSKIGLKTGF